MALVGQVVSKYKASFKNIFHFRVSQKEIVVSLESTFLFLCFSNTFHTLAWSYLVFEFVQKKYSLKFACFYSKFAP